MPDPLDAREAYDQWAEQYDTNLNRTRDLEGLVLRTTLERVPFARCLEIGCGTGKNTEWLAHRAQHLTAVDFSEGMLSKAKAKIHSDHVHFLQADITTPWIFAEGLYDLVTFSLVLEHIEDLDAIFKQVARVVPAGGHVYIGELHPFKQYTGTKARFATDQGTQVVQCFDHHISDFVQAATHQGFVIELLGEHFDGGDRDTVPRIVSMLWSRKR